MINNKHGNILREEILRRRAEYCKELYKEPQPQDHTWESTGEQNMEPEATQHEVEMALKRISNNNAPGIDGNATEMWKAAGEE